MNTLYQQLGSDLVILLHQRGGGRNGHGAAAELVSWAGHMLEAGFHGSTMCVLAGEIAPYFSSEVDELFSAVLDELKLPEPRDKDELLNAAVLILCCEIEEGDIEPQLGLSLVRKLGFDAGYPERLGAWISLSEDIVIMDYGDEPIFNQGLRPDSINDSIRELASETSHSSLRPSWLTAYLALNDGGGTTSKKR